MQKTKFQLAYIKRIGKDCRETEFNMQTGEIHG